MGTERYARDLIAGIKKDIVEHFTTLRAQRTRSYWSVSVSRGTRARATNLNTRPETNSQTNERQM